MEQETVGKSSDAGDRSKDGMPEWYRGHLRHLVREEAPQIEDAVEQSIKGLFRGDASKGEKFFSR